MSPSPTPLWGLGAVPGEWADVCGFIVRPNSHVLSCLHEVWLHQDFVDDRYAHGSRKSHDRHIFLKEKSRPYSPTKERGRYDDGSDHSLSSLSSAREYMLPQAGAAYHLTSTCDFHQRASRL